MSPLGFLKGAKPVTSRNRRVVKSSTLMDWVKNPKQYVRYRHKAAKARYTIDPGGTVILPTGQVFQDPGLTVEFERYEFILDLRDSEVKLIRQRMEKDNDDLDVRLFIVDPDKVDATAPAGFAGKNVRALLQANGVQNEDHLKRLLALAGRTGVGDQNELQKEVAVLRARNEELEEAVKQGGSANTDPQEPGTDGDPEE